MVAFLFGSTLASPSAKVDDSVELDLLSLITCEVRNHDTLPDARPNQVPRYNIFQGTLPNHLNLACMRADEPSVVNLIKVETTASFG